MPRRCPEHVHGLHAQRSSLNVKCHEGANVEFFMVPIRYTVLQFPNIPRCAMGVSLADSHMERYRAPIAVGWATLSPRVNHPPACLLAYLQPRDRTRVLIDIDPRAGQRMGSVALRGTKQEGDDQPPEDTFRVSRDRFSKCAVVWRQTDEADQQTK